MNPLPMYTGRPVPLCQVHGHWFSVVLTLTKHIGESATRWMASCCRCCWIADIPAALWPCLPSWTENTICDTSY